MRQSALRGGRTALTINDGAVTAYNGSGASGILLGGSDSWDATPTNPGNFELDAGDLAYNVSGKPFRLMGAFQKSGGAISSFTGSGVYQADANTLNGIQFIPTASGNIRGVCTAEARVD